MLFAVQVNVPASPPTPRHVGWPHHRPARRGLFLSAGRLFGPFLNLLDANGTVRHAGRPATSSSARRRFASTPGPRPPVSPVATAPEATTTPTSTPRSRTPRSSSAATMGSSSSASRWCTEGARPGRTRACPCSGPSSMLRSSASTPCRISPRWGPVTSDCSPREPRTRRPSPCTTEASAATFPTDVRGRAGMDLRDRPHPAHRATGRQYVRPNGRSSSASAGRGRQIRAVLRCLPRKFRDTPEQGGGVEEVEPLA
jgi:hypothetical protein